MIFSTHTQLLKYAVEKRSSYFFFSSVFVELMLKLHSVVFQQDKFVAQQINTFHSHSNS